MNIKNMVGPFPTKEDFDNAVVKFEKIRRSGKTNMMAVGPLFGRERFLFILESYNNHVADGIIEKKLPKE